MLATVSQGLLVTVEDWQRWSKRDYTIKQRRRFGPPPDQKPGRFTFFDPGFALQFMCNAKTSEGQIFPVVPPHRMEPFFMNAERGCYREVAMELADGSLGARVFELDQWLQLGQKLPSARTIVAAKFIYHLATGGEKFLPDYWALSGSEDSEGRRVFVGKSIFLMEIDDSCYHSHELGVLPEWELSN